MKKSWNLEIKAKCHVEVMECDKWTPVPRVAMIIENLEFSKILKKSWNFGTCHGKVLEFDKRVPPILQIGAAARQLF